MRSTKKSDTPQPAHFFEIERATNADSAKLISIQTETSGQQPTINRLQPRLN